MKRSCTLVLSHAYTPTHTYTCLKLFYVTFSCAFSVKFCVFDRYPIEIINTCYILILIINFFLKFISWFLVSYFNYLKISIIKDTYYISKPYYVVLCAHTSCVCRTSRTHPSTLPPHLAVQAYLCILMFVHVNTATITCIFGSHVFLPVIHKLFF